MKYGKEFQQILNDPSFPEEWKSSAIEYRQLKKLIKDVVNELSSMGLSPEVLHKLLVTEEDTSQASPSPASHWQSFNPASSSSSSSTTPTPVTAGKELEDDGDVLEFEFESDEGTPPTLMAGVEPSHTEHPQPQPKEVILDPINSDDEQNPEELAKSPEGTSLLTDNAFSSSPHTHHRKFRLRLLSESQAQAQVSSPQTRSTSPVKPIGVGEMMRSQSRDRMDDWSTAESSTRPRRSESVDGRVSGRRKKVVRTAVSNGPGGVKAEYELVGDSTRPVPQIRLTLSSSPVPPDHLSPVSPSSRDSESEVTSDEEYEVRPPLRTRDSAMTVKGEVKTPRPFASTSPRMIPGIDVIPPSPTLKRMRSARSPIWAIASGTNIDDGMKDLSLGDAAVETVGPSATVDTGEVSAGPVTTNLEPSSNPSNVGREFIIPLSSDMAFFNLLTAALTSLSSFHAAQQITFRESVANLCAMISSSIRPQPSIEVLATPFTPSPITALTNTDDHTRLIHTSSKASKKDLYAWREIFTLWIEAQIFESSSERDRGERTVEQAEQRLKEFANQVVKRGLGDRRTMKGKKTRGAWEEFLRLNVLLLDLKRFQSANINAARKILKKHDKRTALTASAGFPSFVRSTLAAHVDEDGNVSTWTFYNTSLPHVLLASLTDTLLPILPSLDDYACLICTSIAFKPIRLSCGHLFCVRCLVKMQKAGSAECPLCRSKTVLLADKGSLDLAVMNFMKEWFPKEVKAKQKENESEVIKERGAEVGLRTDCLIM